MRTLAERFILWRHKEERTAVQPHIIDQLQERAREARRFVFDEAASAELGNVVRDTPDLIIREQRWARAPFDLCWIEMSEHYYWDAFHAGMSPIAWLLYAQQIFPQKAFTDWEKARDFINRTGDHTVAFLIDHNRINSIFCGTREHPSGPISVSGVQYRLHTEWPEEDQSHICSIAGRTREAMDQQLWGTTFYQIPVETRALLRATNAVELLPLHKSIPLYPGSQAQVFNGNVGELRTVIAILLMLNRPSITKFSEVPVTRGPKRWKEGATRFSYTSVKVDLNAVHVLKKIGTPEGESVPRRRHEVRGHYAHNQEAHEYQRVAGCLHRWLPCGENNWTPLIGELPLSYEVLHFICDDCGGKRWLVHEHERGDESRGRVIHQEYDVTKKGE